MHIHMYMYSLKRCTISDVFLLGELFGVYMCTFKKECCFHLCKYSSDDEAVIKAERQQRVQKDRQRERHHRHHHPHHHHHLAMSGGYVTRSRDKLREELQATKQRKKEEKKKAKFESKVAELGAQLAATSVGSPRSAGEVEEGQAAAQVAREVQRQKGHGK